MNFNRSVLSTFCFFLSVSLMLSACSLFKSSKDKEDNDEVLARVHDMKLYLKDVQGLNKSMTSEDSAIFLENYINDWIQTQLILHAAKETVDQEKLNFDKQIDDLIESLTIFEFEKELVSRRLDTVIADSTVQNFYESSLDKFVLQDDIYRIQYVFMPQQLPGKDSVEIWLSNLDSIYKGRLINHCNRYGLTCNVDESIWVESEKLKEFFPAEESEFKYAGYNYWREVSNEEYICYYRLFERRLKGTTSPLSYEENKIRLLLMNYKKQALIEQTYLNLYVDAEKNKNFEIYYERN